MGVAKCCAYAVLQLLAFLLHACSLQPALAAGVPCNQVAYASETESQSQTANAQNAQSSSYLYAVRDSETNLWGFVDAAGTQVIPMPVRATLKFCRGNRPVLVTTYSPNNGQSPHFPRFWMRLWICRAA